MKEVFNWSGKSIILTKNLYERSDFGQLWPYWEESKRGLSPFCLFLSDISLFRIFRICIRICYSNLASSNLHLMFSHSIVMPSSSYLFGKASGLIALGPSKASAFDYLRNAFPHCLAFLSCSNATAIALALSQLLPPATLRSAEAWSIWVFCSGYVFVPTIRNRNIYWQNSKAVPASNPSLQKQALRFYLGFF